MGKKNPLKEVVKAAVNVAAIPTREAARAVGAQGAVDAIDSAKDKTTAIGSGVIDMATGEKKKQEEAAKLQNETVAKQAADAATSESARQAQAAYDASEAERMGASTATRTLLTGPAGLDDEEEKSITRRTLQAR